MYKKILIAIMVIVLLVGNIYFYNKREKLDYAILIGTLVTEERIDFNEPLTNRNEVNMLIFSLINSESIEKPTVCEKLPDATIWFNDWEIGITHLIINLWIDKDTIVFTTDVNNYMGGKYKIIKGSSVEDIKAILEKYILKSGN